MILFDLAKALITFFLIQLKVGKKKKKKAR